jgi:hypothetical protein
METEDRYRGIAPAVLIIVLLLLSLVPTQVLGQEGEAGLPPLQLPADGGFGPEPASDEPGEGPVDIPDVKEVITGRMPGEAFGGQVAGIGDVDNDGYDDMAVLVPARGLCIVYHGGHQIRESIVRPLEGTEYILTPQSQVRPAGDIDFDGFDDVLMTAPDLYVDTMRAAGAVFVFYGSPSGLSERPEQVILGTVKDMRLGSDVDAVGDINKDGYADIIVGADGWKEGTGLVRLYLGGPDGLDDHPVWTHEGESPGDRFGHAVTGAGDINADGWMDFAVGAPFVKEGEGKGAIYFFYGRANLGEMGADQIIPGTVPKSYFGLSLRLAGDVNNDGFTDLIISAPEDDSGTHLRAGKVELFLGTEHGINPKPKLVIQGESDGALLGYSIAFLGDINRDGYDDVGIGAPYHTSGGEAERGKFYIFLGDKGGFRNSPSIVEVGTKAGDLLSMGLAGAGDIDGDGFKDVLVGAPGSDTGGGIDAGELHIYRGADLTMPPLQADAFSVMDLTEDELMLVEYREYPIRMSVTHRTGLQALDHIDLHMDPDGEDVVLRFIVETQNLVEIRDDDNLVRGLFVQPRDSGSYMDTTDIILDVWLHWGFPSGRPLSVRLEATDIHGLRSTGRWNDAAKVVDNLDFTEQITIYGDNQGPLASGDWISANEGLSITDGLVVYDLSAYGIFTDTFYYPPNGKLHVVIRDDLGGEWSAPVLKGAPISVHALTPGSSRPEMTYSLSIETVDRSKVFRTEQFVLNVDGTGVTFKNPNPDPTDTIASKDHTITIEIEDPLGPGVDHRSVQYRVDIYGDYKDFQNDWRDAHNVEVYDGWVVADVQETFTEGTNAIQWRAKDLVGNGYTTSFPYPIVVDLGNITFSNPMPLAGKWHNTERVAVGVTVENSRGNDLDLSHIQYRISTSPGTFTPWSTYDATSSAGSDGSKVTITFNIEEMAEGDRNYIQWRARDLERFEYYASPLYRVLIDMSGPVFSDPSPAEDEWVNTRQVTVTITVDDILSGTVDGSIEYHILGVDAEGIWHVPMSKTHRGDTIECTAYISLQEGVDNYILWRAIDAVGYQSQTFHQHIKVDTTPPTVTENLPSPSAIVNEQFVEVSVRVSDNGEIGKVSGVDLRTLQYTIDRPLSGQSSWIHPSIDTSIPIVPFDSVNFYIEVEEGENWLIWRVQDAVGNEVKSEPFGILADLPDPGNLLPVIIISEPIDHTVTVGDLIYFDASQSYHPRGEDLSYTWSSDIDGEFSTMSSFSTHLSEGLHTITLTVSAGPTSSTVTQVYISVEAAEEAKTPFSTLWEQSALALILAFVLITLLLQRLRPKDIKL